MMITLLKKARLSTLASIALTAVIAAGCATSMGTKQGTNVYLDGKNEVPPVTTMAKGLGTIIVLADKTVSGSVRTTGVDGTAAHIHEGAVGVNGPVIVPLTKTADNTWTVPAGARLTDTQYTGYLAGNMYVNVHSAANPGGELRGQLTAK